MSQDAPKIAVKHSIKIQVQKGNKYHWCACGLSEIQPFCDGSHKKTSLKPLEYVADEDKIVGFCGCKYTQNAPMCDGSHKSLKEEN
jgi:CDGSH-type Zn-finger protein